MIRLTHFDSCLSHLQYAVYSNGYYKLLYCNIFLLLSLPALTLYLFLYHFKPLSFPFFPTLLSLLFIPFSLLPSLPSSRSLSFLIQCPTSISSYFVVFCSSSFYCLCFLLYFLLNPYPSYPMPYFHFFLLCCLLLFFILFSLLSTLPSISSYLILLPYHTFLSFPSYFVVFALHSIVSASFFTFFLILILSHPMPSFHFFLPSPTTLPFVPFLSTSYFLPFVPHSISLLSVLLFTFYVPLSPFLLSNLPFLLFFFLRSRSFVFSRNQLLYSKGISVKEMERNVSV